MADGHNVLGQVAGHVKWFDPSKGYGFVVSDDGGPDILLHANVLRNFGQNSVADNARIEVVTHRTDRGVQAVEVVSIEAPPRGAEPVLSDFAEMSVEALDELPMEPARIKWFDKAKGFGFANLFGRIEDVFVHIEVVRGSGFSDLEPGEALAMRVIEGRRGLMAAELLAWDSVLDDPED